LKIIIKGLNYTEIHYIKKGSLTETVQWWALQKLRKREKWRKFLRLFTHGKKIKITYEWETEQ